MAQRRSAGRRLNSSCRPVTAATGGNHAEERAAYVARLKAHQRNDRDLANAVIVLAAKTFEFSDFLVNKLGVRDVGAKFEGKVTFHDGCHGLRELGSKTSARELLANHRRRVTLLQHVLDLRGGNDARVVLAPDQPGQRADGFDVVIGDAHDLYGRFDVAFYVCTMHGCFTARKGSPRRRASS